MDVTFNLNSELQLLSQTFKNTDHEVEAHHSDAIAVLFCAAMQLLFNHLLVANLQGSRFAPGAVQFIQLAESTLCPDAETSNMSTRSESQEVQFVYVQQSDS